MRRGSVEEKMEGERLLGGERKWRRKEGLGTKPGTY